MPVSKPTKPAPKTTKASPRAIARAAAPSKKAAAKAAAAGGYTLGAKDSSDLHDLTLPSGATCQARRPGVQGFIKAGVLDSFDSLTALVQTEHIEKKSTRPQKVTKEQALEAGMALMQNPDKLNAGFQMIDKLVAYTVTQPSVWIDYQMIGESDLDWAKRQEEPGQVGVRDIDLEDKLFLMQWAVGGSNDLAAFREGLPAGVDTLAAIQSLQG